MSSEETKRRANLLVALTEARRTAGPPLTLFELYTVDNRVYKHQDVYLDGYTFRNCAFINCTLHTSKANFHLVSCHFDLCSVHFSGNALRAVRLSSLLLQDSAQLIEGYRARVDAEGGITIE